MRDRPDPQASHAARTGSVSNRERAVIGAALVLVIGGIAFVALSGDDDETARVALPSPAASLAGPSGSSSARLSSPTPSLPAGPPEPTWLVSALEQRDDLGKIFEYVCGPDGTLEPVWGTDEYADHSSVCTAAVHIGLIGIEGGGVVEIVIRSGAASYVGTTRNGVSSQSRGEWPGSFGILGVGSMGPDEVPVGISPDWSATAMSHESAVGAVFDYDCSPGGLTGPIWGTAAYTSDSSVCTAAVHDGRISVETGGHVRIQMREARTFYPGSERHAVHSMPWGSWTGTYAFYVE